MKMKLNKRELDIVREALGSDEAVGAAVRRAEAGEPLAYAIGEWYFYGHTFKLDRSCLIPRPDTEHVVDAVIRELPRGGRFADICCGSGCIAISVLCERQDCTASAFDISDRACEIAALNSLLNRVSERLDVVVSDVFTLELTERYDVIAANPPYIRTDVIPTLDPSVKDYEPLTALDGGEDGMDFYRRILSAFGDALTDGGCFIFEIGYDQGEQMTALARQLGYPDCTVTKDYGGNDRVAVIRRR